jgi:hypothetical protein
VEPVDKDFSLSTHLAHEDWHAQNESLGLQNRAVDARHVVLDDAAYRSGQSHPFPGGLKVIDWRHEPVSDFFSYRSAAAQFC